MQSCLGDITEVSHSDWDALFKLPMRFQGCGRQHRSESGLLTPSAEMTIELVRIRTAQ